MKTTKLMMRCITFEAHKPLTDIKTFTAKIWALPADSGFMVILVPCFGFFISKCTVVPETLQTEKAEAGDCCEFKANLGYHVSSRPA